MTLVDVTGYNVTGTAISWNSIDDAVYLLYPSTMSDTDIRKDLLKDTPVAYLDSYAVTKEAVSPNSDGKRFNQSFSFETLLDDSYKIGIKKPSYAPLVLAFDVDGDDVDLGLLTIYIYGDINGDGSVKKNDLNVLAKHLAGWSGYETLPVYDAVADLNGDGSVKKNDQSILAKHLAGWEGYTSLEDRLK